MAWWPKGCTVDINRVMGERELTDPDLIRRACVVLNDKGFLEQYVGQYSDHRDYFTCRANLSPFAIDKATSFL